MDNTPSMKGSLIAVCGMNCNICRAYLRDKNKCPGCRLFNKNEPVTIAKCKIKNCATLKRSKFKFCFKCDKFPCEKIRHMDKRYQTRYTMSTIENLENIKKLGIREFVKNEKIRWTCSYCGGTVCVHQGVCFTCGKKS
jgi:hypothetical protein